MFTMRTVHEPYTDPDGTPAQGFVLFWPSTVMINDGTTAPSRVRADLDSIGEVTTLLCANDDAGTSPATGAYYFVEEHIVGAPVRRYSVVIPSAGSGTIQLSSLATLESPPMPTFPAPGPQGDPGEDGTDGTDGVSITGASVDGSGHLILTRSVGSPIDAGAVVGPQGPAGSSGNHSTLSNLTADDHAQYHNDTRGDARYYTKSQVDTALGGKQAAGSYAAASHTHAQSDVTGLTTALAAKADRVLATGTTRTASYTAVAADVGVEQLFDSTSAMNFTLPQNSAAAIAIGEEIPVRANNTGVVTFVAGVGATVVSRGSAFKIAGQHGVATARKISTNGWLVYGDITT